MIMLYLESEILVLFFLSSTSDLSNALVEEVKGALIALDRQQTPIERRKRCAHLAHLMHDVEPSQAGSVLEMMFRIIFPHTPVALVTNMIMGSGKIAMEFSGTASADVNVAGLAFE